MYNIARWHSDTHHDVNKDIFLIFMRIYWWLLNHDSESVIGSLVY